MHTFNHSSTHPRDCIILQVKMTLLLAVVAVPINSIFGTVAAINITRNDFPGKVSGFTHTQIQCCEACARPLSSTNLYSKRRTHIIMQSSHTLEQSVNLSRDRFGTWSTRKFQKGKQGRQPSRKETCFSRQSPSIKAIWGRPHLFPILLSACEALLVCHTIQCVMLHYCLQIALFWF